VLVDNPVPLQPLTSQARNRYQDALFHAAQTGSDDEAKDIDDELERYLDSPVVRIKDKSTTFDVL